MKILFTLLIVCFALSAQAQLQPATEPIADWIEIRINVESKFDLMNANMSNRERLEILTVYRTDLERRGKFLTLGQMARLLDGFTGSDTARMVALDLMMGILDTQFGRDEAVLNRFLAAEKKQQAQDLINRRRSSQS